MQTFLKERKKERERKKKTAILLGWVLFFCFFFAVLEFDLRGYTLSQSTSPIFVKGFQDRVSRTICPGWLQTAIFLLSARVIGVSHQCPNKNPFPLDHVLPLASKSYPSLGRQLESGSPQPV
jgi:hypothetical protein